MHTSLQLIALAKSRLALKHNLPAPITDYRFGKLMGFSSQVVSGWKRKGRIGAEFAGKFAEACELSDAYVYACLEHERASPETKNVLERIAAAFSHQAAAVILSAGLLWLGSGFAPDNQAHAASTLMSDNDAGIYIMRSLRRWLRSLFAPVFPRLSVPVWSLA